MDNRKIWGSKSICLEMSWEYVHGIYTYLRMLDGMLENLDLFLRNKCNTNVSQKLFCRTFNNEYCVFIYRSIFPFEKPSFYSRELEIKLFRKMKPQD